MIVDGAMTRISNKSISIDNHGFVYFLEGVIQWTKQPWKIFHCRPEIPCGYCVCLLSPCCTEATILSTNQQTACVAQPCRHPFRCPTTPTEEYYETSTAHAHFWRWKWDLCRTFADWSDPHPPVEMRHKPKNRENPLCQWFSERMCSFCVSVC